MFMKSFQSKKWYAKLLRWMLCFCVCDSKNEGEKRRARMFVILYLPV